MSLALSAFAPVKASVAIATDESTIFFMFLFLVLLDGGSIEKNSYRMITG